MTSKQVKQKYISLLSVILNEASKQKLKEIAIDSQTFEPIKGKAIKLTFKEEVLNIMQDELDLLKRG